MSTHNIGFGIEIMDLEYFIPSYLELCITCIAFSILQSIICVCLYICIHLSTLSWRYLFFNKNKTQSHEELPISAAVI